MKINGLALMFIAAITLGGVHLSASPAEAHPDYFYSKSYGCSGCHTQATSPTCNGCHHHGAVSLQAVTNKGTYAPGETITATLSGGSQAGWIRAILYDQTNTQVAMSSGNASGQGHSTSFPAHLSAPAPLTPGKYTWKMAWFGNNDGAGHVQVGVKTNAFTVKIPDTTKPTLTISALADGSNSNADTLNLSGSASDAGGLKSFTVNGKAVAVNSAGNFDTARTLAAGANTFTVIATDKAGNQQTDTRTINYNSALPLFTVSAPADNCSSAQSLIDLTGTINDSSTTVTVTNNGASQPVNISGTGFTSTVSLDSGINTIVVTATDLSSNTASAKRTVIYDSGALTLAVTDPDQDITIHKASFVLTGTIADASGKVTLRISRNGVVLTPPTITNGAFSRKIVLPQVGKYAITITATDALGKKSTVTRNVIYH